MNINLKNRNILAFVLTMISSFLLFISGTTGVSSWMETEEIILKYTSISILNPLFIILIFIASFGGFAVFIGGIFVINEKEFTGDLLISLGSGAGIITFLFNLFISMITLNLSIYTYLSFSSLGILLALTAQIVSTSKKKKKSWIKQFFRRRK